jgi:drug/metabolite transporter (DMT)-like permease
MGALRHHIALVVSNILFGISFSCYVSLLQGAMSPSRLFAVQLLFAMFVFTPLGVSRKGFFRLSLNDFGTTFIVALLTIFGWWYMLTLGASYTNPIDASTIAVAGPIFTLITSIIAQSRRARRGEILGIIVALCGVVAIIADREGMLLGKANEAYGNAIILCAVVAISVNTVLIAPVLRRHGTEVVMGWYYLIGAFVAMPLIVEEVPTIDMSDLSHTHLAEIGYILIFGSTLPMYLLYKSAEHLTALHNALYRYIQPALATLLALLRGQATIDRTNLIGAALIVVGMSCVALATPRNEIATRE